MTLKKDMEKTIREFGKEYKQLEEEKKAIESNTELKREVIHSKLNKKSMEQKDLISKFGLDIGRLLEERNKIELPKEEKDTQTLLEEILLNMELEQDLYLLDINTGLEEIKALESKYKGNNKALKVIKTKLGREGNHGASIIEPIDQLEKNKKIDKVFTDYLHNIETHLDYYLKGYYSDLLNLEHTLNKLDDNLQFKE